MHKTTRSHGFGKKAKNNKWFQPKLQPKRSKYPENNKITNDTGTGAFAQVSLKKGALGLAVVSLVSESPRRETTRSTTEKQHLACVAEIQVDSKQ